MKKKIEDALRTEYASLGLSDKTIGRLAEYVQGKVEKEEDIATAVKGDDVKLIAKSIQGEIDGLKRAKETAENALADYKAKHPEKDPDPDPDPDPDQQKPDIAKIVADAVAAAVKPVQEAFETFKSQTTAKEAKTLAKTKFYENKWTTKFKVEADDAWERAEELNAAKGDSMSQEELTTKATEYFNKLVQRKGADATKPFQDDGGGSGSFDFSKQAEYLEGEGLLPKEQK